jgi:DNA-binding beta-propeller fold protein YncE
VYVGNQTSGDVSQYTIGATGGLTAMSPATVPAGAGAYGVAVDPSGRYVYVANLNNATVSQFTIGATGGLIPMAPATVAVAIGTGPQGITVEASGHFVYVTDYVSAIPTVSQFMIGAGGALSPIASAPTVPTGSNPASITTWSLIH